MGASNTARRNAHDEAMGTILGMAGIVAVSAVVIPVTLVVAAIVHSTDYVPRAIHWVGRLFKQGWAQ